MHIVSIVGSRAGQSFTLQTLQKRVLCTFQVQLEENLSLQNLTRAQKICKNEAFAPLLK